MPEPSLISLCMISVFRQRTHGQLVTKTRILLAPPFEDNISKRDNLILKNALFSFMKLTGNYEDILLFTATYFHYFLNQLQQTLISPMFVCQVLRLYPLVFLQVMLLPVWNSARIGSTRNQEEEECVV